MNKNVVCTHHGTFKSYDNYWSNAGLNFDYLTDVTYQPLNVGLQYTEQDIRNTFKFEGSVSKKHYWNSYGNRNIIWFYAHLRMVYYYINNKNYNYYWFFDDDVTIDNFDTFFKSFETNRSDFISYYCFKEPSVKSQLNIPVIDYNTTSGPTWFERFPGVGDILFPDTTEYFGSFFPIVRLSNNALAKLTQLLKEGIYGYSEGFVPTVLNYFGMTLDTIFNSDSQSNYFNDELVKVKHKHGKINWEWI